jgi:hypothetical protein
LARTKPVTVPATEAVSSLGTFQSALSADCNAPKAPEAVNGSGSSGRCTESAATITPMKNSGRPTVGFTTSHILELIIAAPPYFSQGVRM